MQVTFEVLPKNLEEFLSLPEFGFATPAQVGALFVVALCAYPENRAECYKMIDTLKGPQRLSLMEKEFIQERMVGKANYIGKAYLKGATPENDYTPERPYKVVIEEDEETDAELGFARVLIWTAGAHNPRLLKLRQKGKDWFLWEYTALFSDVRRPWTRDPWA